MKETPEKLIQNACRKNFKQIIKCKDLKEKVLNNFKKYHITTQISIVIECIIIFTIVLLNHVYSIKMIFRNP